MCQNFHPRTTAINDSFIFIRRTEAPPIQCSLTRRGTLPTVALPLSGAGVRDIATINNRSVSNKPWKKLSSTFLFRNPDPLQPLDYESAALIPRFDNRRTGADTPFSGEHDGRIEALGCQGTDQAGKILF